MFAVLRQTYPDAHCELDHNSPFELLVATVLSAQTTDVAVNKVTPRLFRQFGTPEALAAANEEEVLLCLSTLGMFRQKTKNILKLAKMLEEDFRSQVPQTLDELVRLPGVGRKTANVVLGVAFGHAEGVVVDTHVSRLSQRLGFTVEQTPEAIERDLMLLFPRADWDKLSHTLIFHGRRTCSARKPACSTCSVQRDCPSAFIAEQIGRKPIQARPRRISA